MKQQGATKAIGGYAIYDFVCEGCGAVGDLSVPEDLHETFGCIEGVHWQSAASFHGRSDRARQRSAAVQRRPRAGVPLPVLQGLPCRHPGGVLI
jgi:hypothetical protein